MLEKSLYDSWKSRKWNCNMMNRPQKNDYCFVEKGHLFGFNHEDGGSNYLCCVENREKYTPVQVEATGDRETTGCYLLQLQRARVILPSSVLAKRKRDNMVSTIKTSEFKPLLTVISTLCNQAIDLVAYDSDCDELKLSQICSFMANLSRNGSDALTEVDPHGFEGYLNMVVEVPDSSCLIRSIATCSYPINKHKDFMKISNTYFKTSATLIRNIFLEVTKNHKSTRWKSFKMAKRLGLVDDLKMLKITMSNTSSRNKLNPEINDHYNILTGECQKDELKTKDKA
ncbi:hypothetical protein Tco_0781948 [Tanacetum coccineum]